MAVVSVTSSAFAILGGRKVPKWSRSPGAAASGTSRRKPSVSSSPSDQAQRSAIIFPLGVRTQW